ncbi:MAG: PqqD family protein [Ruminococcaceae bacterium]|nr:PqqD family protein [Oscillospiraceae bacterium]
MKLKTGFVLRKVADTYVVVAVGAEAKKHNVMITLNETGALLWEKLSEDATEDSLTNAILEVYDIDEATARKDVKAFIAKVKSEDLIIE